MKNTNKPDVYKLPNYILWGTFIISIAPFILNLLGIDFASPKLTFNPQFSENMIDHRFHTLNGAFSHALLEWSAFTIAIITCLMAFTTYAIKGEIATPVIGVALLCAGFMDAFHTLAATRLIDAVASNKNLIPFTWAICRLFNSLICLIGVSYFLVTKKSSGKKGIKVIVGLSIFFIAAAYSLIHICATSEFLPQTQFPDNLITRPWDLYPFFIFILSAVVFFKFYKKYPSPYTYSLVLSTIPDLATQLHMALGSSALFDNHFNIAHFLKIIAYGLPLIGLVFEYIETHRKIKVSEQAKTDFLASMSHELRTPMNAIIGFSTICMNENNPNVAKLNAKYIKQSGEELLTLINDILDFSSIEAKSLKLSTETICLDHIIKSTIRNVEALSSDKSVILSSSTQRDIPLIVEADPVRIKQVLLNLVSNAMKFTKKGTIQIKLNATELRPNVYEYLFQVQDSGIGISKQQQAHLFDRFTQVESSLSRTFGGAGLGLAISKQLCELMDGILWVESDIGTGSNFQFKLPLEVSTVELPDNDTEIDDDVEPLYNKNFKVLVAEDNEVNRVLAEQLFKRLGITIDTAINGEEAVNMASLKQYDYIFMDMQMPLLNGVDATKEILKNNKHKNPPLVIAITANVFEEDKKQCHEVGMVDFLEKPLVLSKIKLSILNNQRNPTSIENANILIVEDNIINQNLVISLFKKFEIKFDLAENGKIAVDMAKKVSYDLILMDIQMPVMDGLEATKEILSSKKHTNIVAMTANTLPEDKRNCEEVGMVDYIGKPIDTKHFFSVLRKYAGAIISLKSDNIEDKGSSLFTYQLIDQKNLLNEFKGMEDILLNIVKMYLESCDESLEDIRKSISKSNPEELRVAAHKFKGIVGNFKSYSIVALAFELEMNGKNNSLEKSSRTFEKLLKQSDELKAELEHLSKELLV